MNRMNCLVTAGLLVFGFGYAQPERAAFAAATVKPATSKGYGTVEFKPGGRLRAVNVGVYELVNSAYGLTGSGRLERGNNCPRWIDSERFVVEATADDEGSFPENLSNTQLREKLRPLLQRLLEERFKLVIRREIKDMPVFLLTAAKQTKLTNAQLTETECRTAADCHQFLGSRFQGLSGTAVTMSDLAFAIETISDRPVIDETGLTGLFAMEIKPFATFKPHLDDFLESVPENLRPPPEPVKPSVFSVLEKDFGLLLRSGRARVAQILIESVERPAAP